MDRRQFLAGTAVGAGTLAVSKVSRADAPRSSSSSGRGLAPPGSMAASPPAGFVPFAAPGLVVHCEFPAKMGTSRISL